MKVNTMFEVIRVCGFCLRRYKKDLVDPPRKLISKSIGCEKCPVYFAKYVIKVEA